MNATLSLEGILQMLQSLSTDTRREPAAQASATR